MKVSCLCIGDPHFKKSNVKESLEMTEKIIKHAKSIKPDFIVVMGDVLHEHDTLFSVPLRHASDFLWNLSLITTTFVLVGNHDYINNKQHLSDNHGLYALKFWNSDIHIIDKVTTYSVQKGDQEFNFCFCPYVYKGRFLEALNSSGETWELCECIFAHQEFMGCKMGSKISDDGDVWEQDFPLVVSGHIHDHQILDNVFYTGSIMQHGYAEATKKYLWEFTFQYDKNGELSYKHRSIDLGLKPKKIIYIDIDDVKSFDPTKYGDTLIKLDIKGTTEKLKTFKTSKKCKELTAAGVKITYTGVHEELAHIKKELEYRGKTYINILRDLAQKESPEVLELCDTILGEFDAHNEEEENHVDLEFEE